MARYGGEEELRAAREAIRGLRGEIGELGAKELMAADAEEALAVRIRHGNELRKTQAGAAREAADAIERENRVRDVNAAGLRAETDALEKNTAARQRNNLSQRAAAPRAPGQLAGSLRYATDPLLARANDIFATGGGVRQLRERLGVGYTRARGIMDTLEGGIRPQGLSATARGATDRVTAAELGVARADQELETARRAYASVTRRATATEQELLAARQGRSAAEASRTLARAELAAAQEAQATASERVQQRNQRRQLARREFAATLASLRQRFDDAGIGRPSSEVVIRDPATFRGAGAPLGDRIPRGQQFIGGRTPAQLAAIAALQDRSGAGAPPPTRFPIQRPDFREERERLRGLEGLTRAEQEYAVSLRKRYAAVVAAQQGESALGQATARELSVLESTLKARTLAAASGFELAAASGRMTDATRAAAVAYGTESQALRRRGALTSEFIAAAARGETTMREVGYQAVVTAAKFGGWTIAATALYGAANAMRQVGQGAIAGSTGVHQLTRVIDSVNGDRLQGQFADLAQEFNVPIDVASDAVYRMGQRFHDQESAIEASRAALFSYKTGEVDVATSTQNLIAITRGFGLSSGELLSVYDQINQAQNVFGIRIADTEAGLAKAGGTYRNAGGDLDYLLGLFIAISNATNRSGQEIGTGLARGVNQIRQASNQARLEALGVDVDPDNFQKTIQSAMKAASGGADVNQLASGLLGNQYARLISPVLKDQRLLNEAMRDTSPEASKGSANKELAKVLKQLDEQISSIGVNLQRMGVALARGGVFTPFVVLLRVLNTTLDTVTDIVNVFNSIVPPDIRPFVTGMVEAAAAVALIRRTGGVNGPIADRLPFLANPERRLQVLATRGLRDQHTEVTGAIEGMSRRATVLQAEAEARRNVAQATRGAYDAQARAGVLPALGSDQRLLRESQLARADQEALTAARKANRYQQQINGMREIQLRAEQELATVQQLHYTQVRAWLAENQIPIPAELQTPSSRGIAHVTNRGDIAPGAPGDARFVAAAALGSAAGSNDAMAAIARQAGQTTEALHNMQEVMDFTDLREKVVEPFKDAADAAHDAGRSVSRPRSGDAPLTGFGAAMSTGAQGTLFNADLLLHDSAASPEVQQRLRDKLKAFGDDTLSRLGEMGHTGRIMEDVARRGGGVIDRGRARLSGSFGRMRSTVASLGGMARDFVRGFGLLDGLVAGFVAYSYIKPRIDEAQARNREALHAIEGPTFSKSDREKQRHAIDKALRDSGKKETLGEVGQDVIRNLGRDIGGVLHGDFGPLFSPLDTAEKDRKRRASKAREERAALDREAAEARRAETLGEPVPNRFADEVRGALRKNADDAISGALTLGEFNEEIADRLEELKKSKHLKPKQIPSLRRDIGEARRNVLAQLDPGNFDLRFGGASTDELQSQIAVTLGRMGQVGRRTSRFDLRELAAEYQRVTDQLANASDPKQIAALQEARDQMYQAIEGNSQREVQELLGGARTEGDRRAAFARGRQILEQGVQGDRSAVRRARENQRRAALTVALDQANLASAGGGSELRDGTPTLPGAYADPEDAAKARELYSRRLREDTRKLRAADKSLADARDRLAEAVARDRVALQALTDQSYEDRAAGRQGRLAFRQAGTRDQGDQAATAVRTFGRQMRDALRTYGKDSRQYIEAATNNRQAVQQAFDAYLADLDASNQLAVANAGTDPGARARAAVTAARNTLNALRSDRGRRLGVDSSQIKTARASLIDAQNALADQTRQDALDLLQLRGQIGVARAGDDAVAAARAAQRFASEELSSSRNRKERLQAILDGINAQNQLEDALREQLQARYDLRQASTSDPVEQARLAREAARKALRGTSGTERINALADVKRADRAFLDTRLQSREDDIDFNLQMERISTDVAISQYRALLNMHNLTKQQRRDILLRIKGLQDEASSEANGFDIDVGSIKMPTVYDVRRALGPVKAQVREAARSISGSGGPTAWGSQSPNAWAQLGFKPPEITVNVTVHGDDVASEVIANIDHAVRTSVKAKQRNARVR